MQTTRIDEQKTFYGLDEIFSRVRSIARSYKKIEMFDSDDLAQAVMLKILGKELRIESDAYIHKAVRSVYIDMLRKAAKERANLYRADFQNLQYSSVHQFISEEFDQVSYTSRERNRTCLDTVDDIRIDALSAFERMSNTKKGNALELLLKLACGYSYEQIASEYGIKIGTVRSRIHNARKMLQDIL